jgi:hypothetical protein
LLNPGELPAANGVPIMGLSITRQLIFVPLLFPFGEVECSASLSFKPWSTAAKVEVNFYADPYFTTLSIDDIKMARNDRSTSFGQRFKCRLPTGQHKVTIESKCCFTDEFNISVPAHGTSWAPIAYRRKLRLLPATLILKTRLSPIEIWVNGVYRGKQTASSPGAAIVPVTWRTGREAVHVLLLHPKLGEARRRIPVAAGEKITVKVGKDDFR